MKTLILIGFLCFILSSEVLASGGYWGVVAGGNQTDFNSTGELEDNFKKDYGLRYGVKGIIRLTETFWISSDLLFDERTLDYS